jgi:hypothetical protein
LFPVDNRSRSDVTRRPTSSSRSVNRLSTPPDPCASLLRNVRFWPVGGALAACDLGESADPLRMFRASRVESCRPSTSRSVAKLRSPRRITLRGSCVALEATRVDRTRAPREESSIAVRTLRPRVAAPESSANRVRPLVDSRRETRSDAASRVLVPPLNPRMARCGA